MGPSRLLHLASPGTPIPGHVLTAGRGVEDGEGLCAFCPCPKLFRPVAEGVCRARGLPRGGAPGEGLRLAGGPWRRPNRHCRAPPGPTLELSGSPPRPGGDRLPLCVLQVSKGLSLASVSPRLSGLDPCSGGTMGLVFPRLNIELWQSRWRPEFPGIWGGWASCP